MTSRSKSPPHVLHVEEHPNNDLKHTELVQDAAAKGQVTTGYETLTFWETLKTFRLSSAACLAAAFSAATDGYQIAINASIIANKGFVREFATAIDAKGAPFLESPILSGWAAIMSVGQVIGTISVSFVSSRYGRKVAMYSLWVVLVTSILAESVARTWPVWLIGKLLAGIGVGALQATLPVYISEMAPVRIRGGLLMLYQFWWTVGSFFAQIALQQLNARHPYRYLTAIYTQWAHIGIMLIVYVLLPESPVWCVGRGHEARAKSILARLHRGVPNYDVDYQYNALVMLVEHEQEIAAEQRKEKWYAIFQGIDGRRTIAALLPGIATQFIGLKLFGSFGTYFFQQAGLKNPFTIKCITSSIQIGTIVVTIFTADKFGRRAMACSAATLSWISCLVVGILGVVKPTNATTYVFVLFTCLWNVGLLGLAGPAGASLGEISSQRLRPYTAGFAMASSCVIGIIMDVLVPYMINANKWNWRFKTGFFYAGLGFPVVVLLWLLVPETANRSAAELDELFENKVKAWRFAKTETATQQLMKIETFH